MAPERGITWNWHRSKVAGLNPTSQKGTLGALSRSWPARNDFSRNFDDRSCGLRVDDRPTIPADCCKGTRPLRAGARNSPGETTARHSSHKLADQQRDEVVAVSGTLNENRGGSIHSPKATHCIPQLSKIAPFAELVEQKIVVCVRSPKPE
jgi:hypothetical protein